MALRSGTRHFFTNLTLPLFIAMFLVVTGQVDTNAASPEVIAPEECNVTPLNEAELIEIVATTPVADSAPDEDVSTSEPADSEAIAAVTETVRQSVACANANDPLRAFALFTPRYLQQRFGGGSQDDLGHLLAALSRDPAFAKPEDRLTLTSISDVQVLEDGSVMATVETENANQQFVDELVLLKTADRWLIDRVDLGTASALATSIS